MPRRSARLMQKDQEVMEQLGSIFDTVEVSEQELQLFMNFIRKCKEQNVEFKVEYEPEEDAEDDTEDEAEESDEEENEFEDDANDEDYEPEEDAEEDAVEVAGEAAAAEEDDVDEGDEDYEPKDDDSYVPSPEEDEEEYQSVIFVPEYGERARTHRVRFGNSRPTHRYPTRYRARFH